MTGEKKHDFNLRFVALLSRFARYAILLVAVPIGIVALIQGFIIMRDAYLSRQTELGITSIGVTAFGGILILLAILILVLLGSAENRIDSRLRDEEYTAQGKNSIHRLKDWLPKESENS